MDEPETPEKTFPPLPYLSDNLLRLGFRCEFRAQDIARQLALRLENCHPLY